MAFVLSFEIDGDVQICRSFSRFAEDVQDATEPFTEMADDFRLIELNQFESEGATGSGGWPPLSPSYAAWKAKHFPGKKILEKTGLMKESLTSENPWTIREIRPKQLKVGTRVFYAVYHQRGSAKMPARPPIQLSEADKTRWVKMFQAWLVLKAHEEMKNLMPDITRAERHLRSI